MPFLEFQKGFITLNTLELKEIGNTQIVTLGIIDGLSGLETVFKEESSPIKVQRCTVHVDRNILAKDPKKLKKDVAGENACYRLLAFISLRIELHWRSKPVGKVRKNLPFFKELAYKKFTHKS